MLSSCQTTLPPVMVDCAVQVMATPGRFDACEADHGYKQRRSAALKALGQPVSIKLLVDDGTQWRQGELYSGAPSKNRPLCRSDDCCEPLQRDTLSPHRHDFRRR